MHVSMGIGQIKTWQGEGEHGFVIVSDLAGGGDVQLIGDAGQLRDLAVAAHRAADQIDAAVA